MGSDPVRAGAGVSSRFWADCDDGVARGGLIAPLISFLLNTGARIGEALKLDWRNVDLEFRTVRILSRGAGGPGTKTGASRTVPLNAMAMSALTALPHRTGKVFRVP